MRASYKIICYNVYLANYLISANIFPPQITRIKNGFLSETSKKTTSSIQQNTNTLTHFILRLLRGSLVSKKSKGQDEFANFNRAAFSVAKWTMSCLALLVNFATIFTTLKMNFLSLEVLLSPSTASANIPRIYL